MDICETDQQFPNCSSKQQSKTDSCTNCYSKICDTCQIRQDFLACEASAKKHSSELYVDQIYTCNECDQSWMDLFSFCFGCGRLVCGSFKDRHESCSKVYGLMKSDIIKRRRLADTQRDFDTFNEALNKSKEHLLNIRTAEEESSFLFELKKSVSCLKSGLDNFVEKYEKDASNFQTKLSEMDQYLDQQTSTFETLKGRLANLRKNDTFPVQFLQNMTCVENYFQRLNQNHSQIDLNRMKESSLASLECKKSDDFGETTINNILGIRRKKTRSALDLNQGTLHEEVSRNKERRNVNFGLAQAASTLPTNFKKTSSSDSLWYKIHLLENEIRVKNGKINQLKDGLNAVKKHLHLAKTSRNTAMGKVEEIKKQYEEKVEELTALHKKEFEDFQNNNQHQIDELQQNLADLEDTKQRNSKQLTCLMSEVEQLKLEIDTKDGEFRELVDRHNESMKDTAMKFDRICTELDKKSEMIQIYQQREESLKLHMEILEREKNDKLIDRRFKELEEDNQRMKERLRTVKDLFNEWQKISFRINSDMAYELNCDGRAVNLIAENKKLKEQIATMQDGAGEILNDTGDNNTAKWNGYSFEATTEKKSIFVSSENTDTKNITSITYTAENIHIIKNSQVSLADSGFDTRSLLEDRDNEIQL